MIDYEKLAQKWRLESQRHELAAIEIETATHDGGGNDESLLHRATMDTLRGCIRDLESVKNPVVVLSESQIAALCGGGRRP